MISSSDSSSEERTSGKSMIEIFHEKWKEIHTKSLKVHTEKQFANFCEWMRDLAEDFPCENCEKHLIEYIKENPPEEAIHPFIWGWELHNDVNRRKDKHQMSYLAAIKYWSHQA